MGLLWFNIFIVISETSSARNNVFLKWALPLHDKKTGFDTLKEELWQRMWPMTLMAALTQDSSYNEKSQGR